MIAYHYTRCNKLTSPSQYLIPPHYCKRTLWWGLMKCKSLPPPQWVEEDFSDWKHPGGFLLGLWNVVITAGGLPLLCLWGWWWGWRQAVLTLRGSPSVQRARARLIRACATSSCRCLHAQLVITSESICGAQALREHGFASNNSAAWTLVPSLLHSSPPFYTSPPPPRRSSFQHPFFPPCFFVLPLLLHKLRRSSNKEPHIGRWEGAESEEGSDPAQRLCVLLFVPQCVSVCVCVRVKVWEGEAAGDRQGSASR